MGYAIRCSDKTIRNPDRGTRELTGVNMLQVEREGLGTAPGYLLLGDRKSHALARMKTKRGSMRKRVVIVVL